MATEETTITELELAEEVLADMVIPVDTSTDTKSVSLKQLRAWLGSSLPTGFILPAVGRIDDERFSLLDGKTLSKQGTYGAFCAKVEEQVQASNWFACSEEEYNADLLAYGQCGKFVIGTDYVRIPTITRFIGATVTLSEIGKTYKESLPNIKFKNVMVGTSSGMVSEGTGYYGSSQTATVVLNASRISSTYQDGAKVQPDHTKYPYYMVISTEGQTAEVGVDINKVYEDMNLKANTSLSNVTANIDFVVEGYRSGDSWYRVYKSGWIEQGGKALGVDSKTGLVLNLLKSFSNTNYNFQATMYARDLTASTHVQSAKILNKTVSNITVLTTQQAATTAVYDDMYFDWFACGQGA